MPTHLVLIPSYNPGPRVYETVRSARAQWAPVWVIVDGRAEPAGIFQAGAKTVVVHLRRPVPSGAIVAVTIERAGGSQQPTARPFITSSQA